MDDGFGILFVNICISVSSYTEVIVMKKILGLLMMLGLIVWLVMGFKDDEVKDDDDDKDEQKVF